MGIVNWFDGDKERREAALEQLETLQQTLTKPNEKPLEHLIELYQVELAVGHGNMPIILSRLQLDLANCLRENDLLLSEESKVSVQKLMELSQIRYGN